MQLGRPSAASRRLKKQVSQPSSCNFARGPSRTTLEQNVPTLSPIHAPSVDPLLNETATPEIQEQQEEDHHDDEHQEEDRLNEENQDGDHNHEDLQEEEHHEGDASAPNAAGKILVGVSNFIRDFVPRKAAFAKTTEIIHGHFNGPWPCISKVPDNVKNMWFEEFEKSFCWTVPNATIKKVFLYQAGRHLSNVFKPYYKNGATPFFVKEVYWQSMITIRTTDPDAVRRSEVNKKNRGSKRAIYNGPYRGGSRKVGKWITEMEKEKGTKPMISEVVKKLWSKDKDGTELGPRPATFVAEFERLVAENPSSEPISINKQMELWLLAIKGLRNGRVFGLGEVGVSLVRSGMIDNLNDISCLSTIHTQEHMEPFKEEIREVRDEMKTLQSQNKLLKDMLELLLEKVQGGASTPT